jgi:hypothetical protein
MWCLQVAEGDIASATQDETKFSQKILAHLYVVLKQKKMK